jgi:hypothetical protein
MEVNCQLHAPTAWTPEKEPPVPVGYETWVGSRAGLDAMGLAPPHYQWGLVAFLSLPKQIIRKYHEVAHSRMLPSVYLHSILSLFDGMQLLQLKPSQTLWESRNVIHFRGEATVQLQSIGFWNCYMGDACKVILLEI